MAKSRFTDRPTVRRSAHGPWSVSVDRDFPYPASDTNYDRPAHTVIRSTVHRSDRSPVGHTRSTTPIDEPSIDLWPVSPVRRSLRQQLSQGSFGLFLFRLTSKVR
uniref:Uncharacterized protein n=1 Tax=Solanum tuberosum TaxID=4113 RepID=M1BV44_SOLTU